MKMTGVLKFRSLNYIFVLGRCNQQRGYVRVRFAPSPTGLLHLGGMRTAFYNFAFAMSKGGSFIVRVEDTDRTRIVPGAVEKLLLDLDWLGLKPDEGPGKAGAFGPYVQSERKDLYVSEINKLLENGTAYKCFCSERRLDLLRKEALKKQEVPKYDNRCRHLSQKEISHKLDTGTPYCIRFKLSTSEEVIDLVFGKILHEVEVIEGDPVILKRDGFPTYHFANVVDDHHMKISHVIRGVEWMQSLNKHVMIYKALGYKTPHFAHLPLLLNEDGSKMSKRHGDLSIESFRNRGILPRALLNFVTRGGTGFQDLGSNLNFSLDELCQKFDIEKINTASSKLPMQRLGEFNRAEIERQVVDENCLESLASDIESLVKKANLTERVIGRGYVKDILRWITPRITTLNDVVSEDLLFLWSEPTFVPDEKEAAILKVLREKLGQVSFEKEDLAPFFKEFAKDIQLPYNKLMMLMRSTLCGLKKGPTVIEMMLILGKDVSLQRIERAFGKSC